MSGMRASYLLALGVVALTVFAACGGSSIGSRSNVDATTDYATSVVGVTSSPTADDAAVVVGATSSPADDDAAAVVSATSSPTANDAVSVDAPPRVINCDTPVIDDFADELGFSVGLYMDERTDSPSCPKRRLEPWPDGYIMPVSDNVEIRFAYLSSGDYDSFIFIWHILSGASIHVDSEGRVVSLKSDPSPEALAAVCEVLSDETVMSKAQARAIELRPYFISRYTVVPNPCDRPEPPIVTGTPATLTPNELEAFFEQRRFKGDDDWPEGYRLAVNDEVEIRFLYPVRNTVWTAPIIIRHIPTSNRAWVNLEGRVLLTNLDMGPDSLRAICAVLSDELLMEGVNARAVEIGAYWRNEEPRDDEPKPDPCGTLPGP